MVGDRERPNFSGFTPTGFQLAAHFAAPRLGRWGCLGVGLVGIDLSMPLGCPRSKPRPREGLTDGLAVRGPRRDKLGTVMLFSSGGQCQRSFLLHHVVCATTQNPETASQTAAGSVTRHAQRRSQSFSGPSSSCETSDIPHDHFTRNARVT
ncbi:hypothetical protein BaRGS_00031089 [Batillaria attramentaria]|uniref:Uncharacterized protein n=1 Tax=Batillaria attramentaria TaxID=370345 RepID=A0ABD0JSP7_9CAEN